MMKTITVKGVGNVSARPDYITISMTVESMDSDYEKAMDGAARRIENLKAAAVSVGYEKEALKTTSFNVETRYENVKDRQGNYIHRLEQESQEQCCQERKKDLFEKGLHIRTLRPIRLSVLMPTRYQLSSISIRVGFQ